jgi:hypothetical protein
MYLAIFVSAAGNGGYNAKAVKQYRRFWRGGQTQEKRVP